jgi:type II secretory pathway predicted ATPase ExeA
MSHLATATEQPDCLVVICGADGSGKTTLLNRYITSLGDDISYATIDETCNGEKPFYSAFLKQLGFADITGTSRELRRITKEFLVHRGMAGDTVLLIIDSAHLIHPRVYEQLRQMAAIRVKNRRVLSVVLAGNADLERIMDSPAMSQIKFHSHVHFNIRVYTEEETANYVWHHLRLAGGSDMVKFTNEAHPLIYRYTGGIPKLINMLCHDLLTEAHNLESNEITEELVRSVADNRRLLPHVVPLQGKGRRKTDPEFKLVQPDDQDGERITPRDSKAKKPPEKARPKARKPNIGDTNLLEQISELSAQVGEFRADRMQALEDIGAREKEVGDLKSKLEAQIAESKKLSGTIEEHTAEIGRLTKELSDSKDALDKSEKAATKLEKDLEKERKAAITAQTAQSEKLASVLDDHSDEIERLKQALSDSTKALLQSEKASTKLANDLEKERKAALSAQTATAKANTKLDELGTRKSKLQKRVDDLKAELKEAKEEAVDSADIDKITAELKDEIDNKADELAELQGKLDSRDEAFAELDDQFKELHKECAALRLRAATRKPLEESVSVKDQLIADLQAEVEANELKIKELESRNEELESDEVEDEQAECIATLETELDEARQMLGLIQDELTGSSKKIEQAKAEMDDTPEPGDQAEEISMEPEAEDQADESSTEPEAEDQADESSTELEAEDQADESPELKVQTDETLDVPVPRYAAADSDGAISAFEVFKNGKSDQVFEIAAGDSRIMIGRSEDSELCLKSEFVSRHHALIISSDDEIYIEDLNSFNGTLVNSDKITRHKLQLGDTITIGKYEIKPRAA